MTQFYCWSTLFALFALLAARGVALPSVEPRGDRTSNWPKRPDGVDPGSFPASEFENFEKIWNDLKGFDDVGPAAVHAPVFLYARTLSVNRPCYPESGVANGGRPNEGKAVPGGMNPGEGCPDPGPYHGAYSPGNPFPVYVSATWCGDKKEWRVNYDVYYAHDGASGAGHRHDWEGVTVVFKPDPNKPDANWYLAMGVIFNRHGDHDWYAWKDIETVFGEGDVKEQKFGTLKKHPKVYVGFYSHSAYRRKCDASMNDGCDLVSLLPDLKEYRSNDWYRIVTASDLRLYAEIEGDWNYGDADSTPRHNHEWTCGWKVDDGLTAAKEPRGGPDWTHIKEISSQGNTTNS